MSKGLYLAMAAVLAGCGGGQQFTTAGIGPVSRGVSCLAEEISEAGWTVVSRNDDAGMLRAERGGNWIEARVLPEDEANGHVIRMNTSDTPEARDTVEDVISNCK